MNSTGNYKRRIKPEDLVRFTDDNKPVKPVDPEERRLQMLESARRHKAKFWRLINGRTLDDVKVPGDAGQPVEPDVRGEAVKALITGGK